MLFRSLLVRWLLGGSQFDGPFEWAAYPHDEAYGRATARSMWEAFRSRERAAADRMFREAAMCPDVINGHHHREPAPAWRAWGVWAFLRVAGFCAWKSDSSKAQRSLAKLEVR